MRRLGVLLTVLLVSLILYAGNGSAEYLPQYDTYIEISTNGNIEHFPLDSSKAQDMFEHQESIHEKVEQITGRDVDHSYIWIVLNGETIVAADPPVGGF
ncbi:hypothetical protein [Bacillus sp. 1NLA3E]|uniref:hypothetical protein n=1 Tax=Bacillus sp. 1NLA3E TaxID=666686 RepID=UPI000247F492|nr:hypothetical protein [Bacillus sp. 1NLA3E]AGK54520.1 hypothetical protein B1NLA3E_13860 [Bacillus sp. 1NLA3E]